jgi:hypothetical protein
VGPVAEPPTPPLPQLLSAAGCAKLRRLAAGDVGAEPALDRLPARAVTAGGGATMQERRSRGAGLSADGRRNNRPVSSGDVTGLAAAGGDSA